jgi:hypothetical protein
LGSRIQLRRRTLLAKDTAAKQRKIHVMAMSIRRKAWRNAMVATINEALDRRLFSLEPDGIDIEFPQIDFEVDGIPASAVVRGIGWDEIHATVRMWPGRRCFSASGWLERRKGKWLQTPSTIHHSVSGNNDLARRVAAIQIEPKGYADNGQFFL